MAAEDFNYQEFAQNLAAQAQDLVPADFDENQKAYVINTLGNFALMAGEALATDPNLNFNADQCITITQIIAEWSFHKSCDVIRSGIPQQYWDGILQKIAYTIFEIAKQAFSQNLPNDKILELVEHHVKKTYLDAIKELKDNNAIDEKLMEFASTQSNMDRMAQEMQQQAQAQADGASTDIPPAQPIAPTQDMSQPMPSAPGQNVSMPDMPKVDSKVMKLATVAMLFKKMNQDKVQAILNTLNPDDAQAVIKYMQVPDLKDRIGAENAMRCLVEIKTSLPKSTDLDSTKIVKKLRKFTSKYSQKDLDKLLINERAGVKRLVFMAADGEYFDKMPLKIASIVATHLCNSV